MPEASFPSYFVHLHSMRAASGDEVLVARVVAPSGRIGFGFSFREDATEARHMAEYHAGVRDTPPEVSALKNHSWEQAWLSRAEIPWTAEEAFAALKWLPSP
jgi:hypothetical protein